MLDIGAAMQYNHCIANNKGVINDTCSIWLQDKERTQSIRWQAAWLQRNKHVWP